MTHMTLKYDISQFGRPLVRPHPSPYHIFRPSVTEIKAEKAYIYWDICTLSYSFLSRYCFFFDHILTNWWIPSFLWLMVWIKKVLNFLQKQDGLNWATLKISSEFSSNSPLRTHKSHSTNFEVIFAPEVYSH